METMATFRLRGGSGLTADAVTARLGLQPTGSGESVWQLSSSAKSETGVELATQLRRLLAILEPVTEQLWDLTRQGYEANWFCYLASHATEHAAELDRELLLRLVALPGDLWLDACGDGVDAE
jgi:hypothetical protein